jgi:Tol biopolymer transport system component
MKSTAAVNSPAQERVAGARWSLSILVLAGYLAPLLAAGAEVQNWKLNDPLVEGGNAGDFAISPNGQWVVYRADRDIDEVYELFSVPIHGGTPVRLNAALPAGSVVWQFQISADSRRVVYIAPQQVAGRNELFSVPIEGPAGAATKLNGPLVPGGYVGYLEISPDARRVAYTAVQVAVGVQELYSVPIDGPSSAGIKLNPALVTGGAVLSTKWGISQDSQWVVYCADLEVEDRIELFSVPIAGPPSASERLNGAIIPGGGVDDLQISPDGTHVLYKANQMTVDAHEIFCVPIRGPAAAGVKLNITLPPQAYVWDSTFTPDGQRVLYSVRESPGVQNPQALYSVPTSGPPGESVRLTPPLVADGEIARFQISPDGRRLVYAAERIALSQAELYSVPIEGPISSEVNLNCPLGRNGTVPDIACSPDGLWVVYRANPPYSIFTDVWRLFRAPIDGPGGIYFPLTGVNSRLGNDDVWEQYKISRDSARVVYRADHSTDDVLELYMAPMGGPPGAQVKLNGTLTWGGEVTHEFEIAPDSAHVVYAAYQDSNVAHELYASYLPLAAVRSWDLYR